MVHEASFSLPVVGYDYQRSAAEILSHKLEGMDRIFLVLGYGVPADIFADDGYRAYLGYVFNQIYEDTRREPGCVRIVFCGGHTDMLPPYRRSEAGEMKRYFAHFMRRDCVRSATRDWMLLAESASLSTLENLLNAHRLLEERRLGGHLFIFCEFTRRARVRRLARIVFGAARIRPVDFSLSSNRYLGADYLRVKEREAAAFDRWALASPENFRRYHANFVEKFAFLRSYGPDRRQEAIKAWWENGKDRELRKGIDKK